MLFGFLDALLSPPSDAALAFWKTLKKVVKTAKARSEVLKRLVGEAFQFLAAWTNEDAAAVAPPRGMCWSTDKFNSVEEEECEGRRLECAEFRDSGEMELLYRARVCTGTPVTEERAMLPKAATGAPVMRTNKANLAGGESFRKECLLVCSHPSSKRIARLV